MDKQTAYHVKYFQNWHRQYHKAFDEVFYHPSNKVYADLQIEYQKLSAEAYKSVVTWRGF